MVKIGSVSSKKVPDKQFFNSWREQLSQLSGSLNVLTTTTEDEFLAIGRAMTDFYKRAGEITQMLSSLLGIISGDDMASAIQGIGDIQGHIKDNLFRVENTFEYGLKMLQQTMEIIHGIKKPLENFKKIVKILKILSISTKIEGSQLSQEQAGFIAIANDVEKLSVEIHEETQNISTKILLLDSIIGQNISHISSLDKDLHVEIYAILEDIKLNLILLNDKNESSRKEANFISGQYREISRHIEEVVRSIQFHDIVRQTIEHVKEALDNLARKLGVEDLKGDIEKIENNSKRIHLTNEVGDICELQRAQLNDAKQRITGATRNIIDSLLQIKESIMKVSHKAGSLTGLVDESSLSFLSKMETGISTAALSLRAFTRVYQELSEATDVFLKTTADVSDSVNGIEQIDEEIELIAINARIKTAHTGEDGAPLGVIAEAIQRLSSDANSEKTTISAVLKEITLNAQNVQSYTQGYQDHSISETDEVISDFDVFADKLRVANKEMLLLVNNIYKSGKELVRDIERTVSEITVHEKFERIINNVISILGVVSEESGQLAQHAESGNKSEYLQHLKDNYTMHRERKVHNQFTGLDSDVAARTSADKDKIAVEFLNTKTETHQEFGDNVELF